MTHPVTLTQEQLKSFVAVSPISTAVIQKDGTIIQANQSFALTFGQQLDKVIGSSIEAYINSEERQAVADALNLRRRLNDLELKTQKADGTIIWTQLSVTWLEIAQEERLLVQFSDITHLKQTEKILVQQTQSLEALTKLTQEINSTLDLKEVLQTAAKYVVQLLDVTSAYITAWDESNKTLTVIADYYSVKASPQERVSDLGESYGLDMYEITADWMHDADNFGLAHVDDPNIPETERAHLKKFGGKTVLDVPMFVKERPIGTLELWESRQRRNFTQAEIDFLHAIAQQVAMAIENARLYTAVEATNRLKTEFLAKVSHELRTPLGVILGYGEMLEDGMYGTLSSAQLELLHHIIENTEFLTSQVNDLLDASWLDAGKLRLNMGTILVQDILDWISKKFKNHAKMKALLFEVILEDDVPATINGDWTRIKQILQNLLGNAIKYTDYGRVSLRIYTPKPAYWAVAITDSGPGIPEEAQRTIFEPFRQVDDQITRQHAGTGLGLAISDQLAKLMGGDISLNSQIGEGSTFTLILPLEPAKETLL